VSHKVIYEQPLNERIRAFLRLESLFQQVRHHLGGPTPWDSRATITTLLDILNIFGRSDLKTEVMKELDRHTANLARLENNPEVDRAQLSGLLDDLEALIDELHGINGPLGAHLKGNEFLAAIQQRSAIPGGTCDFDLPAYHYWLQLPAEDRMRDLAGWLEHFDVLGRGIRLILRLTRQSTLFQMVRIALPAGCPWFAEISGGRPPLSVRFLTLPNANERAVQTTEDVDFELACCII